MVEHDQLRLRRRRPKAAPDLLKMQREALGRAEQDHRAHRRHIEPFGDQVARGEDLHRAVREAGDGAVARGYGHGAVHRGGAPSRGGEARGDLARVAHRDAEGDRRKARAEARVMLDRAADHLRPVERRLEIVARPVARADACARQVGRLGGRIDLRRHEEPEPHELADARTIDQPIERPAGPDAEDLAVEPLRRCGHAEQPRAGERIDDAAPRARSGMMRLVDHDEIDAAGGGAREAPAERLHRGDLDGVARRREAGRDDAVGDPGRVQLRGGLADQLAAVHQDQRAASARGGGGADVREDQRLSPARGQDEQWRAGAGRVGGAQPRHRVRLIGPQSRHGVRSGSAGADGARSRRPTDLRGTRSAGVRRMPRARAAASSTGWCFAGISPSVPPRARGRVQR
nr:hypothetical protein [Elioraea sp.]